MLVLLALIGDEKKAGYNIVRGKARVDAFTGANYFEKNINEMHGYVL